MNATTEDVLWVRFMRIWLGFSKEEIEEIRRKYEDGISNDTRSTERK